MLYHRCQLSNSRLNHLSLSPKSEQSRFPQLNWDLDGASIRGLFIISFQQGLCDRNYSSLNGSNNCPKLPNSLFLFFWCQICRHFHPTYFIYFTSPVSITNQFCSLTFPQSAQHNSGAQPSQKRREGEGKPVVTDTFILLVSTILSYLFFSKFLNKHISFFPIKHTASLKCTVLPRF